LQKFHEAADIADAREVLEAAGIECETGVEDQAHSSGQVWRQYRLFVPKGTKQQAERLLRAKLYNPEMEQEYRRHFEELTDEELLGLDRKQLFEQLGEADKIEVAQSCFEDELLSRGLRVPADLHMENVSRGASEDGPVVVAVLVTRAEADQAREILEAVQIPCQLENEASEDDADMPGSIKLLVGSEFFDRACEILEAQLPGEDG
jgi:hypothetical protein